MHFRRTTLLEECLLRYTFLLEIEGLEESEKTLSMRSIFNSGHF